MLRIVCDKCNGTGEVKRNDGSGLDVVEDDCLNCGGDGCIEVEGTLEDLERDALLGQALHGALSRGLVPIHQGQGVYRVFFRRGTTYQYSCELIEWYRGQKGG